jgi:hypothetical protein
MERTLLAVRTSALALFLAMGCGGSGTPGTAGPAGVPRTATVVSLTMAQISALCDWINVSVRGYGSIDNCDGGRTRHADSTPSGCISGFGGAQACPTLTVGMVEDCINAIGGDLCRTDTEPTCAAVEQCPLPDGGTGN